MDFLCNECAKSFAKEVDLVVHQLRAHDKRPFSCPVCKENFIGKDTQRNHTRKHNKKKETTKTILTCSSCTYETPHKQNLNRHVKTHDNEKVNGASMFCPECGKSFPAKRNLTRHLKIHQKKTSPSAPKQVEKVKSNIGYGTFLRGEKGASKEEILCAQCTKKFRDGYNLERHIRKVHEEKTKTKRRRNRTTVMRQVKRMLAEEDYLNEIARQRHLAAPSGPVIDETLIETIMVQIPQMSNRNILRTLSILRKKLPKEMFKTNLRKVLARRSNLLDDLFHTEYTEVVDDEGEKITMPVTSAKHLPTLISLVCEKRGLSEDNIKLCLGLDGGQSKLIATLASFWGR